MAFFNVSSLGGNPFHTQVGRSIEQATDGSLASENWALNMEICDLINESSDTARDAMKAIRKRLSQNAGKNSQVIMYTLTVLETCVKNCGKAFHVLVAQKDFINELVKLIGPKNEPPLPMQEKVLSLIQIWADAFKNQPDLSGVGQVYAELKNKGIEFPQTDLDTMAPIYTPQRSVPEVQPQMIAAQQTMISPQQISVGVQSNGPAALTPEQTSKLQSELEIVAHNMAVLGEMLSELKPGQEEPEDYQLLQELTATCKEMQLRIMELIGRINDDELTAECLRLNDELNNLFLRHQRYEKNRSSSAATSPSAILGAAMGVPGAVGTATVAQQQSTANATVGAAPVAASAATSTPKEPLLIDLASTEKLANNFSGMGIGGATHKDAGAADEFDMLAQSRTTDQNGGGARGNDLLRDIPSVEAAAGSIGSPYKRNVDSQMPVPSARQSELDEMEAWLGSAKEIEGMEETLTSTEFDKFLEERAAAADQLPTINANTPSASGASSSAAASSVTAALDSQQQQTKKTSKKPVADDNLLAL